jgi:hypothetical protein
MEKWIDCPQCTFAIPFDATRCLKCGHRFSWRGAGYSFLGAMKRRILTGIFLSALWTVLWQYTHVAIATLITAVVGTWMFVYRAWSKKIK